MPYGSSRVDREVFLCVIIRQAVRGSHTHQFIRVGEREGKKGEFSRV